MTFLAPWTALVAAAVAVPLLLLLYFLKLRRRRLAIASTFLWRKSYEDFQANVPFQRLRLSALLLLQALVVVLLLVALAEPVIQARGRPASRIVLLIDRSASMNAGDVDALGERSRLDAAKDAAKEILERLGTSSRATQVMVISFGVSAEVICGFDSRREVLVEAIESIEPSDEEANLAAALQLAGVFAGQSEDGVSAEPPDVMLISDGTVSQAEDEEGFSLRAGRFRFIQVRPETDQIGGLPAIENVGLVSLNARRDYHDPTQVLVFARLINVGSEEVDTLVRLLVDGETGPMERVAIPPPEGDSGRPGEASTTFAMELPGGAVLSVRQSVRDALAADDTAAVILPPPAQPRMALVHRGVEEGGPDPFLEELLEALNPAELRPISAEAFADLDLREVDVGRRFDLIVFDRVRADRLPGTPTITFGAVPRGIEVIEPSSPGGKRILSWRRQHPLMRHVSLETVAYTDFGGMELAAGSTGLASGPDGPVMALLGARGARHVVVGFALSASNWPLDLSAVVFLQNVVEYLTLARTGQTSLVFQPGEAISARAAPETETVSIVGPAEATVRVEPGQLVTLPALRRVGVYRAEGVLPPHDRVAVSLLSEVESDIRPRSDLVVNARTATASGAGQAAPRDLWPWLAGAALALLVVEWLVYCRMSRR